VLCFCVCCVCCADCVLFVFVDRVMCVVPRTHVPVNSSSPLTPTDCVLCVFVDRVMCVVPRTHVPVNSSSPLTPTDCVLCVFVDRVMCVVPRTHVPVNSSSPLTPNKYVRLNSPALTWKSVLRRKTIMKMRNSKIINPGNDHIRVKHISNGRNTKSDPS